MPDTGLGGDGGGFESGMRGRGSVRGRVSRVSSRVSSRVQGQPSERCVVLCSAVRCAFFQTGLSGRLAGLVRAPVITLGGAGKPRRKRQQEGAPCVAQPFDRPRGAYLSAWAFGWSAPWVDEASLSRVWPLLL